MNKYRDKSDFEINKAVAEYRKLNTIAYDRVGIVLFDDMDATPFDPCNNPADAMLIVIENGISIIFQEGIFQFATDGNFEVHGDNPYRAAMEVFLMMKDAENEK